MFINTPYKSRLPTYLISVVILVASTASQSEDYPVMPLFGESESGVFHDLSSGKLLKLIIDNQRTVYLEQDGDIFEEDVATLDEAGFGLQSTYSFDRSKRLLGTEVYTDHLLAFYSGCRYRLYEKKFVPVASSCGFKYRKSKSRSERIEWEHIVPAWHFGHQLKCWQDGGRLHCRKSNEKFRQMEADMHNLVPAIGEINGDRSNFSYGMISGEPRAYGEPVNMEIEFKSRIAEPPESAQGDIARTYFYMAERYNLQISSQQKKLFIAWNNLDPVDSWEQEKNQRVKAIQGDENTFVTNYRKLAQGDVITSSPDTDAGDSGLGQNDSSLGEINESLKERFRFLYDYLPVQIVEGLLLIVALYIFWRRKRNKEAEAASAETPAKQEPVKKEQTEASKKPATEAPETPKAAETAGAKEAKEAKEGYLKIRSAMNQFVLSLNDDGELVVERSSRAHSQRWKLEATNKTEGFVFIQHIETGQVLAVEGALKKDDAKVIVEDQKRRSNNHQEWRLTPADDDETQVFIENRATGYVLDITDKNTENGASVASYHRKTRGTENQQWIIGDVSA